MRMPSKQTREITKICLEGNFMSGGRRFPRYFGECLKIAVSYARMEENSKQQRFVNQEWNHMARV